MNNSSSRSLAPDQETENANQAANVVQMSQNVKSFSRIQWALKVISDYEGGTVLGHCVNPIRTRRCEEDDFDYDPDKDSDSDKRSDSYDDEDSDEDSDETVLVLEEKPHSRLVARLNALRETSVFCIAGSIELHEFDRAVQLKAWKNGVDKNLCAALVKLPADELLKYAKPSPFGDLRNERSVVDENVRVAAELSDNFKFKFPAPTVAGGPSSSTKRQKIPRPRRLLFLDTIRKHIERDFGQRIQFHLHKINIYSEGGFFKSHVDTPVDPKRMIASLVVCLPSAFEGGELLVEHWGKEETIDFAPASGKHDVMQWAAFYSDCHHEVKPVTKGHRITLTLDVFALDPSSDDDESSGAGSVNHSTCVGAWCLRDNSGYVGPTHADDRLTLVASDSLETRKASLQAVFDVIDSLVNVSDENGDKDNHPPPLLGIFLTHRYTFSGVEERFLKGVDRDLFDKLSARFHCSLISVVDQHLLKWDDFGDFYDYNERENHVYAFTRSDLKALSAKAKADDFSERRNVKMPDHTKRLLGSAASKHMGSIPFIRRWLAKGVHLKSRSQENLEFAGNEPQDGKYETFYFHCALIVAPPIANKN